MRSLLAIVLLGVALVMGTGSSAQSADLKYVIEFRLTQHGRKTYIEVWTQPNLGQDGIIYFETAEGISPLERLTLNPTQAQIQESAPTRFITTPYHYYAPYKRERHQRLDRIMLKISDLTFPIRLAEEIPDGVYKLIVEVAVDQDGDGAFADVRVLKGSAWLQFCLDYDHNPLAHPLQTAFFKDSRGDGSMDWNCNGKVNLSQVTLGEPGVYELRGNKCVEVIPPVLGWATFIPTEVGVVAHCYSSLTDNSSIYVNGFLGDIGPICRQLDSFCVQQGN